MSKSRLKKQTIEYPVGTPKMEHYTSVNPLHFTLSLSLLLGLIITAIGWAIYKVVNFF